MSLPIRRRLEARWENRRQYSLKGIAQSRLRRVRPLRDTILASLPFEHLPGCTLCVSRPEACDVTVVALRDRYGFPVRLGLCSTVGGFFLFDRLTREGYEEFYGRGLYREIVHAYYGVHTDPIERQRKLAVKNAGTVVDGLRHEAGIVPGSTLLDVGGSTGVLAVAMQDAFGVVATVLDPADAELRIAREAGLLTRHGQVEHIVFGEEERFDLIMMNETIEHLMDVRRSFDAIRRLLRPGGRFIFDAADFLGEVAKFGCAEAASRLDHCVFFCDESVSVLCAQAGFAIERRILRRPGSFMYVCRLADPRPDVTLSTATLHMIRRSIFDVGLAWRAMPPVVAVSREEKTARKILALIGR